MNKRSCGCSGCFILTSLFLVSLPAFYAVGTLLTAGSNSMKGSVGTARMLTICSDTGIS